MIRSFLSKIRRAPSTPSFDQDFLVADLHMNIVTAATRLQFGLDRLGDWLVELDQERISWTFEDGDALTMHTEIVGTWSKAQQTFMWSWANPVFEAGKNLAAHAARNAAKESGCSELAAGVQQSDLAHARSLAGLAFMRGNLTGVLEQKPQIGIIAFLGIKPLKAEALS